MMKSNPEVLEFRKNIMMVCKVSLCHIHHVHCEPLCSTHNFTFHSWRLVDFHRCHPVLKITIVVFKGAVEERDRDGKRSQALYAFPPEVNTTKLLGYFQTDWSYKWHFQVAGTDLPKSLQEKLENERNIVISIWRLSPRYITLMIMVSVYWKWEEYSFLMFTTYIVLTRPHHPTKRNTIFTFPMQLWKAEIHGSCWPQRHPSPGD